MYCNCDCVCFMSKNWQAKRDALVSVADSVNGMRGSVVLVKRSELEQFNSYNVVTDKGRLVKFITSRKGVN